MAATASSLPRAVQRPLANYSSISWFLVAFCKAKITWFAVNTKHSTNCWENTKLALPQARVLSQDTPAWLGFLTENAWQFNIKCHSVSLSSFCSFHHFRTDSHYQRDLTTYLQLWKILLNQGNCGLSHSLLLSVQGKHMSPFSWVGLEHVCTWGDFL